MIVVLDTNAYSDWRRYGHWNREVATASKVIVPAIVLGELRAGFQCGRKAAENEQKLDRFLNHRVVEVGTITDATSRHYAVLKNHLRNQGMPIPEADVWIAAVAIECAATLLTGDEHFAHLPQVRIGMKER